MKYVYQKYFEEIEHSELDLEWQDNIMGVNPDGHDYKLISDIQNDGYWYKEAEPIEIDLIIQTLQELKEQGANYVEVLNDCDHHGYVFNGIEMRLATDEEIKEYHRLLEEKEQAKKDAKIAHLELQLKELKEK